MPFPSDWAAYGAAGAAILGLIFAAVTARWITRADAGSPHMQEIAEAIREGALAFLNREYRVLALFVVVVAALLVEFISWKGPLAFVVGAILSVSAGNIGMRIATRANVRTAQAARTGLTEGLGGAFRFGAVRGFAVVGLGLLGITILWLLLRDAATIFGFSFGASSVALFARVGGGIYTKAADVGADLVGKVEAGIPEDDPRNPAVIADNVGDNVGDVAGMGADLFESYVGSIVGAMIIGWATIRGLEAAGVAVASPLNYVILPMVLAAFGILCSIAGTFMVRTSEGGNPQTALNMGTLGDRKS